MSRTLGPCFHCFEMGHLKAAYPKLASMYYFESSIDVCSSTVCMYEFVCVYKAKGEPDCVSSLKRGDYAQPTGVYLRDTKTTELAVCLVQESSPKVQQGIYNPSDKILRPNIYNM